MKSLQGERTIGPEAPPGAAHPLMGQASAADRERVLLLECRLEEMRSAIDAAREEADRARTRLAEAATREADHARRYSLVHEELAGARTELAALHRRLERSDALRREIAGHLFESGPPADAGELVRLRRKVLAEDQRALVNDRTVARLRERVEELVASRETLLTRVAEWQQLIREDGPGAADLSEFLAELRREILDLEREKIRSDAREGALRSRLAMAGIDTEVEPRIAPASWRPDVRETAVPAEASESDDGSDPHEESGLPGPLATPAPTVVEGPAPEPQVAQATGSQPPRATWLPTVPGDRARALAVQLAEADVPTLRANLLVQLGRTGDPGAVDTIHRWTEAADPSVRAAAYEAIGRLLEHAPSELEPYLRDGLADPDARVRRRVVLAAATARGVLAHALLEPLQEDPDPQVRRVIRQVLRQVESVRFRSSRTLR